MSTKYSIQKMVSDGTLSTIALGIQYLQRNDIYMRIAGEDTPQGGAPSGYTWSFLDNTTLKILPVVPNGVEVAVYRRTDVDAMYNIYSQNAQFDEATIDENNTQLLYIAQEYLEQDLTGVGIVSLEYVRSEPGYEIYRFKRSDGTYFPEFPVPTDTAALETHKLSANQHPLSGVTGLLDELSQLSARIDTNTESVLDVRWLPKRSPMRTGYASGDGQTLSRALYPDAFAAIQAGLVPVCSDADWLADPAKRGCFTLGDGSTTFRVPDYNGVQPGSYGPVYLGGGNVAGGSILRDRIQNITGEGAPFYLAGVGVSSGALSSTTYGPTPAKVGVKGADYGENSTIKFDASRVARTGATTRPITAEGCIAIRLFGAVQNAGSADAAALASAVVDLSVRVSVVEGKVVVLEQRKSTCLVNATGTGAPHETVVAQLPANITINSRYVIPNPFGSGVPVLLVAEIFLGGAWCDPSFVLADGNVGYGVKATHKSDTGIIVQTGVGGLVVSGHQSGTGHTSIQGTITSAPCRVFVHRLEA